MDEGGTPVKCDCGNDKFFAHQILRVDVVVNENGQWYEYAKENLEYCIYDAEQPYGPFTCTKCGKEYENIQ